MLTKISLRFTAATLLALLIGAAGCATTDENLDPTNASLIGGAEAEPGQFPATVALLVPRAARDTRYCVDEDRRCTMTRVGARAYLAAAHCFADKDELEQNGRVVLSPLFQPGKPVGLSHGPQIWEIVEGTCPEQDFGTSIMVPAPGAERVAATVRKVHFHPSYLTRGSEAGEVGGEWPRYTHADVAILEVAESHPGFVDVAKVDFTPLQPGAAVVIAGHGISGGFAGSSWSGLKFASRSVEALVGQDFFTKTSSPFGGPGIAPGDSGGAVFLASDASMRTIVGVNSKSVAFRGSAHVRLDDGGTEAISAWYRRALAEASR